MAEREKEEFLMPPLYEAGFTGPSDVMWGVDDEIVHELSDIPRSWNAETAEGLTSRLEKLVARIREMIYKEEQTLFPLCQENFDKNTWYEVYRDLPDFGWAFIASAPKWLDDEVWSCHPPRVQPIVRSLIADFKAGIGVDCVVDAAVVRHEAAEHLAVRGIDDRIGSKPRDVSLPDRQALVRHRDTICRDGTSPLPEPAGKIAILHSEELGCRRPRRPHIHECSEQQPLVFCTLRNLEPCQIVSLRYELLYEPEPRSSCIMSFIASALSRASRSSRVPHVAAQALRHLSAPQSFRPRCGRYRRARTRHRLYPSSNRQPPSFRCPEP